MTSRQRSDRSFEAATAAFTATVSELQTALADLGPEHCRAVYAVAQAVLDSWERGGKLLVCGNGGSAADSQHIVAELVGRYLIDRPGFAAIALNTNTSTTTAVGNDYGFAQIFARQVTALGRPEDILLVISTSGNSPNCVAAVGAARAIGMAVYGFLGGDGGQLLPLVDGAMVAPSSATPKVQEVHITMGHFLCWLLEQWGHADRRATGCEARKDPADE